MMTESLDMLVFGAHADDAEIGMGGTIASHVRKGQRVGLCDLTYAELSSNGTPETRLQEAGQAAAILGAAERINLGIADRGIDAGSAEQIAKVAAHIRSRKPRIVFAPFWQDRHPDHNACSQLVEAAVFNAKLRKYMPESNAWQVEQLIFYYINDQRDVSLIVNVSEDYGTKIAALRAFDSQFGTVAAGEDRVSTPLTDSYVERVQSRDMLLAQTQRGWTYAEGFAIKQPHAIQTF